MEENEARDPSTDQLKRTCFRAVNTLLKPPSTNRSQSSSTKKLCSDFATYFAVKTQGIRVQIQKKLISDKEFSDYVVDVSSQPVPYQLNRLLPTIAFIGKVLEKVAVHRLTEHLAMNGLHEEYQSAYKMLHSTETALFRVKHDIAGTLDRNHAMVFVMLDLSAAFDTIDHAHLFKLLQDEYGVRGTALAWFRTYMEDRTYRVQIDSTTSAHIPLQYGVPQGSVLGPVIFTLYTTTMQRIFRRHGVHYHKYADDIQLYAYYNPAVPGDQVETVRQLRDCIREVRRWMTLRMLKLNDDKTEMIILYQNIISSYMEFVLRTLELTSFHQ